MPSLAEYFTTITDSEQTRKMMVFLYTRSMFPRLAAMRSITGRVVLFMLDGFARYRGLRITRVVFVCSGISSEGSTRTVNEPIFTIFSFNQETISPFTASGLTSCLARLIRMFMFGLV